MTRLITGRLSAGRSLGLLALGVLAIPLVSACSGVNRDAPGSAEQVAQRMLSRIPSATSLEVKTPEDRDYLRYEGARLEGIKTVAVIKDSQSKCVLDLDSEDRCVVGIEEFTTREVAHRRKEVLDNFSVQNPPNIIIPHVRGWYVVWFQVEMPKELQEQYLNALKASL